MVSLRLDEVSAGYRRDETVLDETSAVLKTPGLYLLRGANGAGKSTFFEVLAGFLQTNSGDIRYDDEPLAQVGYTSTVSLLRNDPDLVPFLTLADNMTFAAKRCGADERRLRELIEMLELEAHLEKLPSEVSTGTLRKAWVIMGMFFDTPVTCFDEPFNGLDHGATEGVARELAGMGSERIVLLSAHVLPDVLEVTADLPDHFRSGNGLTLHELAMRPRGPLDRGSSSPYQHAH